MADVDGGYRALAYYEADPNVCYCPSAEGSVVIVEPPSIVTALADSEYGVDIDVITDVNPAFTLCRDLANMGNAIARRLSTPSGMLAEIGDDPDYGYDLRGLLNDDMTTAELAAVGSDIEQEIMKEERVQQADVTSTFSFGTYQLGVELNILLKTGVEFRLVLGIGTVSVDVIDAGIPTG